MMPPPRSFARSGRTHATLAALILAAWTASAQTDDPNPPAASPGPAGKPGVPASQPEAAVPDPEPPSDTPRKSDAETDLEPTRVKVTGLGWLENLRLKAVLRQLHPKSQGPTIYDANAIEDGAFLLLNHVQSLGFLDAHVACDIVDTQGRAFSVNWQAGEAPPLPRPVQAETARFTVTPGLRYFYEDLVFRGLTALSEAEARGYFVRSDGLLQTRVLRRFSPRELDDSAAALRSALEALGHARARVTVAELSQDETTGAVHAVIEVDEGPVHHARDLEVVLRDTRDGPEVSTNRRTLDRLYSRITREDLEHELLVEWYRQGFPDASSRVVEAGQTRGPTGEVEVDLRAEVVRGPRVRLGTVRFVGPTADRDRTLLRKTRLKGPWLDRLAVDQARARLARLGAYRFVNVRYEPDPEAPDLRHPVFELEPGRQLSVDVLAGFRSFDLLYGGVDLTRRNLFGLGHVANLRFIQSFRSSEGYVAYSVPDVLVDGLTVFGLADALIREEVSFRREELRLSLGARHAFEDSGHQVGLRYNYEFLRAIDAPVASGIPQEILQADQPDVASISADWILDRRDSAVTPRRGFRVGASMELASPAFGGEARFLRPELEASWHLPLGGGRFVSAGARYALITDPGNDDLIPFNKRIFAGGEDSVRGYQRGEAGSLNPAGEIIGSESALVWNLEFEQQLTEAWSIVAFADGVGESARVADTLWEETLWSLGGGVRWNTAVGPIRLEYGHNLTRRTGDPSGTLHFSVGFPF